MPPRTLKHIIDFEFSGKLYALTGPEATLLAETLRNYARGAFPPDVALASQLSGKSNCFEGALAVADFTEEALVGNLAGPLPLEGKAAEATFWTLRIMQSLGGSTEPNDMAALRDALAELITGNEHREAA